MIVSVAANVAACRPALPDNIPHPADWSSPRYHHAKGRIQALHDKTVLHRVAICVWENGKPHDDGTALDAEDVNTLHADSKQ